MRKKKELIICMMLIIIFFITSITKTLNVYTYIPFIITIFILCYDILGFRKEQFYKTKQALILTFLLSVSYLFIMYGLANVLNLKFGKTIYDLSLISIAKNTVPLLIIIIFEELIRYMIIAKNKSNKLILLLAVIVGTLMNITLSIYRVDFNNSYSVFKYMLTDIFPFIAINVSLTLFTKEFSFKPSILYRIIFELYIYVVPIFPNISEYVNIIFKIIFPLILYSAVSTYSKSSVERRMNDSKYQRISMIRRVISYVVAFVLLVIVGVNSGMFKYYSVTIGSGSMVPVLRVGDVIVLEKYSEEELKNIKVGDILVFKHNNDIIVHRVLSIGKDIEYRFSTKGDANENADNYTVKGREVIGVVKYKIRYFGLPSVWLNEMLKNAKNN